MEKENKQTILIHSDVFLKEEETKKVFVYSCINEKMIQFLLKVKNKNKIIIKDKTFFNAPNKQEFFVNNHVNKTGENPIRGRQSLSREPFFDITGLYFYQKKGVITTSCGKKYLKMKKKQKYPSTYMSNIAILCRAVGFKKIIGILINNQEA